MATKAIFGLIYWVHTVLFWDRTSFFHRKIVPFYADWYHRMFSRFAAKKDTSVPLSEEERKKIFEEIASLPCITGVEYGQLFQDFEFHCPECDRVLDVYARAKLLEFEESKKIVELKGYGLCHNCRLFITILLRWHPDSGEIFLYENDGRIREFERIA